MAEKQERAGPWILEPAGLQACGNVMSADVCPARSHSFAQKIQTDSPRFETDYATHMSSKCEKDRIITSAEVEKFLSLSCGGQDDTMWEVIKEDSQISTKRYRDLSLFPGAVLARVSAQLANTTAAHVAHCFLNFADREAWDKQVGSFRVLHNICANDVLYYNLKAAPLHDRDFVVWHTIWRHESGRGLLIYNRSASDVLSPPTSCKVRATQYVQATEIMEDGQGNVRFSTTAAIDPCVPIPKWLTSMMIPREFRKWVAGVEKRCAELRSDNFVPPCNSFFVSDDIIPPPCTLLQALANSKADKMANARGEVVSMRGIPVAGGLPVAKDDVEVKAYNKQDESCSTDSTEADSKSTCTAASPVDVNGSDDCIEHRPSDGVDVTIEPGHSSLCSLVPFPVWSLW
eukprot:TRINITY_DN3633_c0_g2_i1.p1 TRINITY_DN3633_c0_g2~~TRINITY_DN3633_c0_g2_i1.p1  ORF type:complete len:402 (+),score=37.47 TRINITY_DN3633_c0_g2_i1:219-1424(+)